MLSKQPFNETKSNPEASETQPARGTGESPGPCCRAGKREKDASARLQITPAQASALARLLQIQIRAYSDAAGEGSEIAGEPIIEFTVSDLELIEPLVLLFEAHAKAGLTQTDKVKL